MNRLVAQAFQPAGLPDFRVRWTRNGRLESRRNPQARKPALRTRLGSWSQCAPNMTWRLSMNLAWFGVPPLGGSNGLGRLKPGLQAVRGSWSQCAASKSRRLSMNLKIVDLQTNDLRKYGSWSQCARKKGCRLPMNRKMPPLQM